MAVHPPAALGDNRTRVLLAVIRQRRPTVRSVADEVGLAISEAHRHLLHLRADGLVAWEDGTRGTLRSLVKVAA